MTTTYTTRTTPTTTYTPRVGVVSDLGYLITQLGILCDTNGNRIVLHTGTFYPTNTLYTTRNIP